VLGVYFLYYAPLIVIFEQNKKAAVRRFFI